MPPQCCVTSPHASQEVACHTPSPLWKSYPFPQIQSQLLLKAFPDSASWECGWLCVCVSKFLHLLCVCVSKLLHLLHPKVSASVRLPFGTEPAWVPAAGLACPAACCLTRASLAESILPKPVPPHGLVLELVLHTLPTCSSRNAYSCERVRSGKDQENRISGGKEMAQPWVGGCRHSKLKMNHGRHMGP